MVPESRVTELIERWEQRRLQGEVLSAEELCGDTPELLAEVRRHIDARIAVRTPVTAASERPDSTVSGTPSEPTPAGPAPAIPGYEVLDELGRGGMGVVYKVRNIAIGRVEALKVMRSRRTADPLVLQRFQLEIRAMAPFEHPRIVRIYAAGEHDGQPYFTMEYVPGGSLARNVERYLFTANPRAAVELLARVARAVHYLHARNILHRDLKPANILLRADEHGDEPLVSDFGLAKYFDRDCDSDSATSDVEPLSDSNLTQTGAVIGTTLYMSPEQATGGVQQLTAASDVWALGVILFELLTGRRPFVGPDREAVRSAIRTAPAPSPRALQPQVDADLAAICCKCLAKDPRERYESAAALADDLERWLRAEPILPERWPRRAWRRVRQHRAFGAAVALLLAGSLLVAGLLLSERFHRREPTTSPPEKLQAIRTDLDAGRRVTLIGDVGPPAWYRWIIRGEHDTASDAAARPFSVHGDNTALIELLPADAPQRYRLQLQIHHHGGDRIGSVGIYFAHAATPAADGRVVQSFAVLSFNDVIAIPNTPPERSSQARLNLDLLYPREAGRTGSATRHRGTGVAVAFPTAGNPEVPVWRTVQLEVTPEQVQVHWEHRPLPPVSRARLDTAAKGLLADSPVRPIEDPQFRPQDALGLYVNGASAWFRSCTIEPLPAPEPN